MEIINNDNQIVEVSIYQICKALTTEDMAKLLDEYVNSRYPDGKKIGEKLRFTHRTIQRSIVVFALDIIIGIADQEYTDARNEVAIETAKKIKEMEYRGELQVGLYR
jgi:hypothetical protein